ncbi:hypothetical protein CEXT_364721 [Caerostris extrusa]|uniref:Uncharacterized protein n=1 Tax=Caerostris extrusa TaxID=172846 RepID=A0AAV4X853_CAEEX|nr:hypothetical protein CEXT_364721 [Caerostris extrusa]
MSLFAFGKRQPLDDIFGVSSSLEAARSMSDRRFHSSTLSTSSCHKKALFSFFFEDGRGNCGTFPFFNPFLLFILFCSPGIDFWLTILVFLNLWSVKIDFRLFLSSFLLST